MPKELEYEQITAVVYTDSQVVLGYIKNDAFAHLFWHSTNKINPQDLIHNSSWLNGQTFLWEREFAPWTRGKINFDISSDDPEAHVLTIRAQPEMLAMIPECLRKFSHCNRANRAISVCAKFKSLLAIRKRKQPEEVKKTKEENKEVIIKLVEE